jgi:hypothetical protein
MPTIPFEMMDLRALMTSPPSTMALLVGEGADKLAVDVATALGGQVVSIGGRFAEANGEVTPDATRLFDDGSVFTDLDVLFWAPAFHLEVMTLLRQITKSRSAAFVWPGTITDGIARYSEPGRHDMYEAPVERAVILRVKAEALPGDAHYTTEWVGA